MVRFCLLTVAGTSSDGDPEFMFQGVDLAELNDQERRFRLTAEDVAVINPVSKTCPIFRTRRDADLAAGLYRRVPILRRGVAATANPWGLRYLAMFHMANDSDLFFAEREDALGGKQRVPLYESKMVNHYNHRFGDFSMVRDGGSTHVLPTVPDHLLANPDYEPSPRYWVASEDVETRLDGWPRQWLMAWRDVTDARASVRSVVPAVVPRYGVGHNLPVMLPAVEAAKAMALYANLASFVLDYSARQKIGGLHLTIFVLDQLPVLSPETYDALAPWDGECDLATWVSTRVLELLYAAHDLQPLAADLDYSGPPFRWDPARRALLRAEIDAAFFHLYGIQRDDVEYVMDTFPIVRRRDEQATGEYRTKHTILEIYDKLAEAIATGRSCATLLDPPPADPRLAHPSRPERREAVVVELPFRRVTDPLKTAASHQLAPIYTLRAAAGAFGGGEAVEPDGWAELNGHRSARPGMFVAQVRGRSMEPRIPDGAWCLFATPVEGARDGRILLVEHRAIDDPDNGGSYTVKRYRSRKRAVGGELWEHEEIVLEPLNGEYEPIVLRDVDEGEFRVIAELIDVLG